MKVLLVGCGSKFGLLLANEMASRGHSIYSIGSSESNTTTHLKVDWNTVNVAMLEKFLKSIDSIDLIFFNQNSSSLNKECFNRNWQTADLWKLEKNWSQTHFVSCILPMHIINSVARHEYTKTVWMLSSLVYTHSELIEHADYAANKYQNYVMMKNFGEFGDGCFIGINPEHSQDLKNDVKINELVDFLEKPNHSDINGRVYYLNGTEDINFNIFKNT